MPRIDEMPEFRAKIPRSVHDLSHKFGFTATVAHLLPVFHDFVNAGETIELGFSYKLRTQPLQSAAMVDIKSHVEYFFVPIFLLYEPFGSMFFDVNDNYSSLYPKPATSSTVNVQNQFPVLNFTQLWTELSNYSTDFEVDEDWFNHVFRLLDMFGMSTNNIRSTTAAWNPNVFPYQLLAYHCIYQYYYRLDTRELFDQHLFNWDKYYNTATVTGDTSFYKSLFHIYYRPKDSDYFTDNKVSPIVDVLNLNVKSSLEMAQSWLSRSNYLNYQGASRGVLSSGGVGSASGTFGADGGIGTGNAASSVIQTKFGFPTENRNRVNAVEVSGQSAQVVVPNGFDINTANIRALFAAEKLWSITGRARKHYDDQTLAHYGFQVPHDVKHEISCFGHDRGVIHIGEVISTASTTTAGLGEIAGKGYGELSSKPHKFTAPCHGVVMAILSFVPDVSYGLAYLKANSVTSRNDLYQPEYDHLGLQPLFGYETDPRQAVNRNTIMGWQYRYEQWKRRYNRVSKAFTAVGTLDSWMLNFQAPLVPSAANTDNVYKTDYWHYPTELNQIMLSNYVNNAPVSPALDSSIYDGDPFVVDGFVHCKKVSTMSDYSLPRLDA